MKSEKMGGHQEPRRFWWLRLYVAGRSPRSQMALYNLKRLCETHVQGRYHIEVVDLMRTPQQAKDDHILAIPTVVRKLPLPLSRLIGDLSNTKRVLSALDLPPSA